MTKKWKLTLILASVAAFAGGPKPVPRDQQITILHQEVAGYKAAVAMIQRRYDLATEKLSKEDKAALQKREEADAIVQVNEKAVAAANAQIDQWFQQAQKQSHCEKCSISDTFQWSLPPKKEPSPPGAK